VPVADKDTIVTVTLAMSCDVYHGSTITILGLTGTQTADTGTLALTIDKANLINANGAWTQSTGALVMTVATAAQDNYANDHWETGTAAEGTVVVSFKLQQGNDDLPAGVSPTVTLTRHFAPYQYGPGTTQAPWWGAATAVTTETMDKPGTDIFGVTNGVNPLVHVIPALDVATVTQSSPFINYENTITVSFSCNVDLTANDVAKIKVETLTGSGIAAAHAWSEVSGFAANEMGTANAAYATDSLEWTVATSLSSATTYVWSFAITNPAAAQAPTVSITVATTKTNNDAATANQAIAITHADPLPDTALKGVTAGLNALKIVVPFEVRTLDDTVDTPGAPNIVTVAFTTNIAFVSGDQITITGLLLGTGSSTSANVGTITSVANSATAVFGTGAAWNQVSGELVFTCTGTAVEATAYSFKFTVTNPPSTFNTVPSLSVTVGTGNTPGSNTLSGSTFGIQALALTQSAGNTDTVSVPFTIIDPVFTSLVFSTAEAPGAASELVITFTPGDEVTTSKTNLGVVTIILPGFTGGTDSGYSGVAVTSVPDTFNEASFTRLGASSILQLTTTTNTAAFDASVAVTVPASMGIKLPANGVTSAQSSVKLSVGPNVWSEEFSVTTMAAVTPLITGVRINALAAKGAAASSTVATMPKFDTVLIGLEERADVTATIFQTGDEVSIRQGSTAWGCYSTRADAASTTRTADIPLNLIGGASPISHNGTFNASGLDATTATGTTYTLCFVGADILAAGVDSETSVTIELQSKVTSIELNSNGNQFSYLKQSPRNDFSIRLYGDAIADGNTVAFIPDASACTAMNTANSVTFTGAATIASSVASFAWAGCIPLTSGVPRIMDSANCPTDGLYRLCYHNGGDSTTIETGISTYYKQVNFMELTSAKHVSSPTFEGIAATNDTAFGENFVHEVYEPFTITVLLKDENGNPCCEGTKVFLALTKAGADDSSNLYNAAGSNTNTDKIVLADANGVATFTSYTIRGTAGKFFYFTASVAGRSLNFPATGAANAGFQVRPTKLTQYTTLVTEYIVGANGDNANAVLGDIEIRALDRYNNVLAGLVTADDCHCEAMLETGNSGVDSAQSTNFGGVGGFTASADLTAATVVFNLGKATFSGVKIAKTAGRYFRLKYWMTEHAGSTGAAVLQTLGYTTSDAAAVNSPTSYVTEAYSTVFMLSPAKMKLSWGGTAEDSPFQHAGATDYTASTFPIVTRLDGSPATYPTVDAPNTDGLPSAINVILLDADGSTLSSTNCTKCFYARLVKCDDSTPTNGTTTGMGLTNGDGVTLPACVGQAIDANEPDQMAGMTQALCATNGGECTSSTDFQQTLSSSPTTAEGTEAFVANGIAAFYGLQARYTFGAGFLLRFVMDPQYDNISYANETLVTPVNGSVNHTEIKTVHTAANGQVFFPDIGAVGGGHVESDHKSMIIRPYNLEVAQHPGGDGVDLDGLGTAGDGTVNTPDGVGAGQPFRVQPAVVVKGYDGSSEYYFSKDWANHGHMPITAVIKSETCGQDCVDKGIALTGTNDTGVSLTALQAGAFLNDGTGDLTGIFTGDPSSIDVELAYSTILSGNVGFYWRDLKVLTRDSDTGFEGLKLMFMAGWHTHLLQEHVNNSAGTFTTVDSGYFDVFTAPGAPLNLQAIAYGELGFRIEYDPSEIARLKPLSGFIVEIDFCTQSGSDSGSCATRAVAGYPEALSLPNKPLGSDLYTGGGRTEEVQFSYSPTTGGAATEVNVTLRPKDHIYGGDELRIHLNYPGLYRAIDYSGSCVPEGSHGSLFTADINANTSVLTLTAVSGAEIARGQPVTIMLPLACEIIYPDNALAFEADNAHLGSNHTKTNLADYQSSRYGTKALSPPMRAIAYVVGPVDGSTGDNCKNVTCTVSSTKVLPIVQDSNTMDLTWSGSLQFGAVGVACDSTIGVPEDTSSQTFPNKRYCSMASTGSNDLDAYDHVEANPSNIFVTSNYGNSGQNGKPIGSNAGRAGRPGGTIAAEVTQSSGTLFVDSSSLCRAGGSTQNPCMLPSGEEWNPAVALSYNFTGSNATTMTVNLRRDERCIQQGTSFTVPIPLGKNAAGNVSPLGCSVVDGADAALSGWTCHWIETTWEGTLVIYAGSTICPPNGGPAAAVITTTGDLALTSTSGLPSRAVAVSNNNAGHATLIVRNGASLASYTTLSGDPVGNYAASTATLAIAANDIVSLRVYAYNGRFRSPAAETPVQTRAILKPTAPAYFSDSAQRSVGVVLSYSQTNASVATEITIDITAPADLLNGTSLNVPLAGFSSAVSPVRDIETGHAVFTIGQWNSNTSVLSLIVAPNTQASQAEHYTIIIPSSAGILYPATGTAAGSVIAMIATYTINWVTPFPIVSRPRKGFVVQMTTDRNWNSDISTLLFADKLNNAADDTATLGYLQADVGMTDLNITLLEPGTTNPTYDWLVGRYIKINAEVLKVTNVTDGMLFVLRGQISTAADAHSQATGGGTCACDSAGAATGTGTTGLTCACTKVYAYYISATDPSVGRYNGFDLLVGTAGNNPAAGTDGCRIGAIYWPLGCNIRVPPVAYSVGVRSFQSAVLQTGQAKLNWLTNCGTEGSTCTGVCDCTTPTLLSNTDLGAPTLAEDPLYIRNTGDPLQWSNVPATTLALTIPSTTVQHVILTDSSIVDASYMRLGDELVYVHGSPTRGVTNVILYQVSGNSANGDPCTCDLLGNATGDGTCACFPQSVMTGCTAGGTLQTVGGGGLGFSATFTVANPGASGYIDSITITDPGYGYISIPEIRIESGGDGCTLQEGQSFIAVTSRHTVTVERGALGTTAVTHAAGTAVSVIHWPLRSTRNSPGAQYYFRIAAYNDAGLSDYLYYKHQITEMSPRELPTTGGQTIEVTLEGGGHVVGNTTVYIGHTHLNGTLDESRSKVCQSLVVSDVAGTRLTCVTPPWVGRSHDLLVRYKSGSIEKLSVANNYVSFPAPTIKIIEPVQVTAGTSVIITITGTSFGANNTDVIGALRTSTGENPCAPLTLISDTSALCYLFPMTGQQLDGNIVVGVGTPWSGGQQNSTASGIESKLKEFDPPAEVELTVAKNIDEIAVGTPARVEFENTFKGDVAAATGIPEFRINITSIRPGSVVVVFVILPDPNSITTSTPAQVASVIAAQAADPTSALLTGSVTSAVTGVSVAASVLEAAAQATGTIITTSTQPDYFTKSEPADYTLPNMERCLSRCRRLCETGNEVPSIDGYPVLAIERPRVCKTQCMAHCGFGRPIVRQVFA